jgi:hypothetical protein
MRAARVLHTPVGVDLHPASVANPAGAQPVLSELAVEPRAVLTLPDDDLPMVTALGLGCVMAYTRLRDRVAAVQYPHAAEGRPAPQHLFLGSPQLATTNRSYHLTMPVSSRRSA